MDLKKDWNKLAVAVITGIIGILFVVAMFTGTPTGFEVLGGMKVGGVEVLKGSFVNFAALYLVPAILFLGICAYMILKMLKIDLAKYVILAVGAINLILLIIVLADVGLAEELIGLAGQFATITLYALLPLIKGVKKVIGCKDCAK